jgi:hypothetical protein
MENKQTGWTLKLGQKINVDGVIIEVVKIHKGRAELKVTTPVECPLPVRVRADPPSNDTFSVN